MVGLIAALGAATCYGIGSGLQAIGARRTASADNLDPRLLYRLLKQGPFVAGTVLDVAGFILGLVALRTLPLFVVQVAIASNLAVTALFAARIMGARLRAEEWAAVAAVCVGLAMVGSAAEAESAAAQGAAFHVALVVASVVVIGLALAAAKMTGSRGAAVLGAISGLGFGIVSLAGRVLTDLSPAQLVVAGAAWALAISGVVGFLVHAVALQRGSVTVATVGVVLGETILPSAVGILVLGDTTRPGFAPIAIIGGVVAIAGAVRLSRFGELEPSDVEAAPGIEPG